jgi:PAS domain S-box-containing protein
MALDATVMAVYFPYRHQELIGQISAVIGVVATKLDRPLADAARTNDRTRGRQILSLFGSFEYSVCAEYSLKADQPPDAFWPIPCDKMADRGRTLTIPSASGEGGYIGVILSDAVIDAILLKEFSVLLGLGFAIGAALVASAGLVFNLFINRPLRRLVDAMALFENQNIPQQVTWGSQDELGRVVDRYNAMLDSEVARVEEINAQKAKVQALEERTRSIINNAADGVIVIDQQGLIELFSPAAEAIFGYTAQEVLGRNVSMLMPEGHALQHDDHISGSGQNGQPLTRNREVQGLRKNGEVFPMDLAIGQMIIGQAVYFTGIVRDITERHRAAAQLRDAYEVITTSICYASNIQRAILPDLGPFEARFADSFVLWEPRDMVGGDFYHVARWGDGMLVILADCTGHGVPGAFMTLIAKAALESAQAETPPGNLAALLQRGHKQVQRILGQDSAEGPSDDGLELGACYIPDPQPGQDSTTPLLYAGARFPLFVVRQGLVEVIKGSRAAMGYRRVATDQTYQVDRISPQPGMALYMTTDGLLDQVGGARQRMFGKKRFVALLEQQAARPMAAQKNAIAQALQDYQGDQKRRDDVAVVGFRL